MNKLANEQLIDHMVSNLLYLVQQENGLKIDDIAPLDEMMIDDAKEMLLVAITNFVKTNTDEQQDTSIGYVEVHT